MLRLLLLPSNLPDMGPKSERYQVASFDFNHVATPYIISLWIIIVGLAKIGKFVPFLATVSPDLYF